jgi:hypothetical protein
MPTHKDLENWFTYHPPVGDQAQRYGRIRAAALRFAEVVLENTPPCADQTVAVRHVREAVQMANAAIACHE